MSEIKVEIIMKESDVLKYAAKRLVDLSEELGEIGNKVEMVEAEPSPYQGAYDFKFKRTYNGY